MAGKPTYEELEKRVRELELSVLERKQVEKALRESEEKLERIIHHSSEVFYLHDAEGQLTYVSPQCQDLLGYTPQEILRDWTTFVTDNPINEVVFERSETAIRTGEKQPSYVIELERKDGRRRLFEVDESPIRDESGKVVALTGAMHDITDRRQAEEALRESEERFRFLTESMADVVWTLDMDFKTTYVSPSVKKVLGFTPEERKKQSLEEMVTPESRERILKMFLDEVQHDASEDTDPDRYATIEVQCYHAQGHIVWLENSVKAMRDETGTIVGMYGSSRDITERKRTEEEKARLEQQLRQAQKMEAIGTLAGGIAHDFNNVLGIILGNLELAMMDLPEWSPIGSNLEKVRSACLRARDMVLQILAFSRQSEKDMKPVHLGFILSESLKMLRATIPTTVEIRENVSEVEDLILADPTQVNQVLMNLCANAAHAMRTTGGILEISLTNRDLPGKPQENPPGLSPGKYVILTVSDTGHGITPQIIERIFDPYYTTKEADEGTGMGLAMADGIVKDHGEQSL